MSAFRATLVAAFVGLVTPFLLPGAATAHGDGKIQLAQVGALPGMGPILPFMALPTVTYVGHAEGSGIQNTTYTICSSGCSLAGYYVCSANSHNGTVSSYTINGVPASLIERSSNGSDSELWGVQTTPSGSLSVTIDLSAAPNLNTEASCWVLQNLQSTTPTATASGTAANPSATLSSVSAGGIVIAASFSLGAATLPTASGVTLNWTANGGGSDYPSGGGDTQLSSAQSSYAVTFTYSSGSSSSLAAASFR